MKKVRSTIFSIAFLMEYSISYLLEIFLSMIKLETSSRHCIPNFKDSTLICCEALKASYLNSFFCFISKFTKIASEVTLKLAHHIDFFLRVSKELSEENVAVGLGKLIPNYLCFHQL